jgi:hypothetical protein
VKSVKIPKTPTERVFSKSNGILIMSSKSGEELIAFSGLSEDKIKQISSLLDERVIDPTFSKMFINKIIQLIGCSEHIAEHIRICFYNFYNNVDSPKFIDDIIENSELNANEKNIIKETWATIQKNVDRKKIEMLETAIQLADYGHPHLHLFGAIPEFRPLLQDGKIIRMIPSVVVTGHVHGQNTEENEVINFQVTPEVLEDLIKDLENVLKDTKIQISELKKQLGDNIIVD